MVRGSPAARKSKLLSAALNVTATDPPPAPVLIEVVSADASTALSPPGTASPPDQVIEARLTFTVPGVELVKLRMPVLAVSSPLLPVVWGISMTACSPASGASTGGGALSWSASTNPELAALMIVLTKGAASCFSSRLKLIARNCSGISKVGVLDPPGAAPCCPIPSDKVASAACWAPCSSAIREEEFGKIGRASCRERD